MLYYIVFRVSLVRISMNIVTAILLQYHLVEMYYSSSLESVIF